MLNNFNSLQLYQFPHIYDSSRRQWTLGTWTANRNRSHYGSSHCSNVDNV